MRVPTAEKSIPFSHMRNANLSRLVNLLKCKHRHLRFSSSFFPLVKSNSLLLCCICGVSSIEEHECMKPLLRMAECTCQSPEKKVRNTVSQMRKASRKNLVCFLKLHHGPAICQRLFFRQVFLTYSDPRRSLAQCSRLCRAHMFAS
jgi:hypothetical protein